MSAPLPTTHATFEDRIQLAMVILRRGWCKGAYARDQYGESAQYWGDNATSFCLVGALNRVGIGMWPRFAAGAERHLCAANSRATNVTDVIELLLSLAPVLELPEPQRSLAVVSISLGDQP